ncbi:MAG: YggS family pyridoxal phosphate-dependent enzyme [Actinomycetota bacterium]|nr:YggS family pyridoxal phosphate-dependent enzyme [Actinomycetota bacterium]
MNPTEVAERLAAVNYRVTRAGAAPESVTVVAVTKGHGRWAVEAALAAGLVDIGENYGGELLEKQTALAATAPVAQAPIAQWHFLGHVQRNKVRSLAQVVHLWQGVDRQAAGEEIARRAPGAGVLVQVNVSGEAHKNGCSFDETPALVAVLSDLGLDVRGLMAVGPVDSDAVRAAYRRLNALADRLGLAERSMGMSGDLETAVEEGSTMVRIGQALFGSREARTGGADL